MELCEIIEKLRTLSNRGQMHKELNQLADELEQYDWIFVNKQKTPSKPGVYTVTLDDGNVYNIALNFHANGPEWTFDKKIITDYENKYKRKPVVIAWLNNRNACIACF
jgi:hypothetical protein